MMNTVPKSLRLQIGLFGRTNVGKSSFLNYVVSQEVAITSPQPGTTTDVVEKAIELLPLGPVVFLDTAGIDDTSPLAAERLKKTRSIFDRADIAVLLVEPDVWTAYEEYIVQESSAKGIPCVIVINKVDRGAPSPDFVEGIAAKGMPSCLCSCLDLQKRDDFLHRFKTLLIEHAPEDFLTPPSLTADLVPAGGIVMLVVPIDLEAPRGRLILPQVQTIRETLDNDAAVMVVKEREYRFLLGSLNVPPNLVICDSQAVLKMVADTPLEVPCTTFSILFSRYKGILYDAVRAVTILDRIKDGDKILIAESCSHHPIADDIGRVKLPRWIRQYTGASVRIDTCSGRDFPDDVESYRLIIQCGGCMVTRREVLMRLQRAQAQRVPFTNYGVCISYVQGVLERVLSPFPFALALFKEQKNAASRLSSKREQEIC